jgi:tripartite-type tricarboxylate transporter receptor subunit TctC
MKSLIAIVAAACSVAVAGTAAAQAWPSKPIHLIVPFPPGGAVDVMARTFGQKFSEAWGQQVIVDNRPGAGGNIGADYVARSAPDGYTLLITTTGHAIAPSLYRKLPFDPIKDFAPISQITKTYLVLVVNPSMPKTFKELIALAKKEPGKLNYGHTGLGVAPHLVGEMLKSAAGIDIVMVGYKGDAQTVPAMLSNEVQMGFSPPTSVLNLVKQGKLRALAVSGTTRGAPFPDVPTLTEAGYPDASYVGWVSFFAPGGTPHDILTKVSAETARALKMPDIVAKLPGWGGEAAGTTPEEFAAKYKADIARYAKVIREAHVPKVD